jgi:dGTPase
MVESLRRLRFSSAESRGRRYPEPAHPYRSEFQRDRDRIVHTRAFRRLENKTQVFTPGLSDHFRNRLTHTIEVAQIARTLASVLELEEDFTEALALAHDIGHPPFAHAGEAALDLEMKRFGERFNHNLHALRIVDSFEERYARFPGLNLTFEVREGIVKHSRDIVPGMSPELDEYLPDLRPPLEAQLIDLADEIAYNTADLDDAHSAGLIRIEEITAEVPSFASLFEQTEIRYPGAGDRVQFQETLRTLFDWLVSGLITGTHEAVVAAGVSESADIRHHQERLVRFTAETKDANRSLKDFLHGHVYRISLLAGERKRSADMIASLFQFYLDNPDRMPDPHRDRDEKEPAHRTVCDYIAGMTDPYFERTYRKELGNREGDP